MIYNNYASRVKNIVQESRAKKTVFNEGIGSVRGYSHMSDTIKAKIHEQREFSDKLHLNAQPLNSFLNGTNLIDAKIGLHPDFQHLKGTDNTEQHYIVSVFIDIQGSTKLFNEYDLEDVFRITNTIQSAAIHTCLSVGGHIQRLQGDGVFAYFGGKGIDKRKAVQMAVLACSMFTYFVKNDLRNVFLEDEIEDIKTRIGIDFGDDDMVMWANFGLLEVSELTTLSLHTSLSSKMQSYAEPNGIVVGQYIKDRMDCNSDFFDLVRNSKGEVEQRYIFENRKTNFRYTQYAFDWFRYLKSLPFVGTDNDGNLYLTAPPTFDTVPKRDLAALTQLASSNKPYGID